MFLGAVQRTLVYNFLACEQYRYRGKLITLSTFRGAVELRRSGCVAGECIKYGGVEGICNSTGGPVELGNVISIFRVPSDAA